MQGKHTRCPSSLLGAAGQVESQSAESPSTQMKLRPQLLQQQQGGGGSPAQPVVPTATPPPTANNAASLAVEQATYRQNLRRKNLSSTIYAGAGGWTPSGGTGTAPATPPK
jgi:hypothetical protein